MYWQVTLLDGREGGPQPRWLPEKWTPAPRKQAAPLDANSSDAHSLSLETGIIAMTEAILRLIARYPGLVDKVAHAIALQPGQTRLDHFNTMMEAISQQARYHHGLGLAIDEALEPFDRGGSWRP